MYDQLISIYLSGYMHTPRRGTLLSTAIFLYATTSPVNGYFGGALYSRFRGQCKLYPFPSLVQEFPNNDTYMFLPEDLEQGGDAFSLSVNLPIFSSEP